MQKNFILAIVFSSFVMIGWNLFLQTQAPNRQVNSNIHSASLEHNHGNSKIAEVEKNQDHLNQDLIVPIKTKFLNGKINLKGLKIFSLKLSEYKTEIGSSENVELLTDENNDYPYFISFGFGSKASKESLIMPNSQTVWSAQSQELSDESPLILNWTNKQGVIFQVKLTVKDNYFIESELSVVNKTDITHEVSMYTLINKSYDGRKLENSSILHEGPISVIDGKLEEYSYSSIKDKKEKVFEQIKIDWVGLTNKYFLVAIIPSKERLHNSGIQYDFINEKDKLQTDVSTKKLSLEPEQQISAKFSLFLGPKKLDLLESYESKFGIKLFDRAIDWGWLYIITKPIFLLLRFINSYVANFGASILILTLIIKIFMFKITNKAYYSMKKMKDIQPKIDQIKIKYDSDKMKLNKEILELYRVHNINPFTGILSIFIQIPIFFGIYKVLYVTIEMRHAGFIGWIKDLSAADPSNVFNLFGLINYSVPEFLHIGALPIIMSFSMYLQQLFSPVQDPMQAKVMKFLPIIFLFTFSSFPSGLLIYWTFSNFISITQQMIMRSREDQLSKAA